MKEDILRQELIVSSKKERTVPLSLILTARINVIVVLIKEPHNKDQADCNPKNV